MVSEFKFILNYVPEKQRGFWVTSGEASGTIVVWDEVGSTEKSNRRKTTLTAGAAVITIGCCH